MNSRKMKGAVAVSSQKPSSKYRNNRKRTKVFDPCISNKKKKITDENQIDENKRQINDQFAIIKQHLVSSSKNDLNKTMDAICHELGLHKYISEDDLSDDPENNCHDIPPTVDSVEGCINKMFDGLDEFAAFNPRLVGSTPKVQKKVFPDIDSSIKPSPGLTPAISRKSILKCSNISQTPKQREDVNKTPNFGNISLGSPILNDSQKDSRRIPFMDKTNFVVKPVVKTPESLNISNDDVCSNTPVSHLSNIQVSYFTPLRATPQTSLKKPCSSDVIELSPEIKRTLLVGVACFVDVKTNKQDCSSSVALELLSMGASVEKTLNKKVTHVVFKEGRPSTFFKAKRLGVIMVSVLWLEACKKERTIVDPLLYPPINIDKYENLSPNGTKIPSLRTIQRKLRKHLIRNAAVSADNKTKIRINWRNALTDIKVLPSSQDSSQGRLCNKKLNFESSSSQKPIDDRCNGNKLAEDSIVASDSFNSKRVAHENKDESESSGDYRASPIAVKRKSAPARFISERKKRKRNELKHDNGSQNKYLTIDQLFAKQIDLNSQQFKFDSTQSSSCSQSRKKKLFNPEEEVIVLDSSDEKGTPPPIIYEFPYKDEEESAKRKGRTKSTSIRKIFKKIVVNKKSVAKKSLSSLLEQDEGLSSTRSSLTCFLGPQENDNKLPKAAPTIVFTSMLPEEERKLSFIVGKLGVFDIEDKVTSKTTHLVTSAPRRTINLMKALVRGAWILHVDWIYKSDMANYWLNEEEFELKTFSHAVTEMRRERQAFGAEFCSELFSKCGPVYISKKSAPPHSDLVELVRLCKGRVVTNPKLADYVIGGRFIDGETVVRLKEKWILDSITQNILLDTGRYLIKLTKTKQTTEDETD